MNPIVVGLTATAIGLLIVMAILERRSPMLRAREQAYKLHELRDRLQISMIQDKIGAQSLAYVFLMSSLNLAIRNAGVMSLSQILELARAVNRNADDLSFQKIIENVRRQDREIQKLYDEFFQTLTVMLISNDHLTPLMFTAAKYGARALNRAAVRTIASAGKFLLPEHTEAVYEARQYQRWGHRVQALSY